jgi:two-component system, cell cycle response regulator DivK
MAAAGVPGEAILVVDDNPTNTKLMHAMLEAEGYSVQSAVDSDSMFAALAAFRPRLILMDIQLPGIDGLEITRRLKADPGTRDIVVVALSAYAMVGDKEKALEAGCDGYVSKPIVRKQFLTVLQRFLGAETADSI